MIERNAITEEDRILMTQYAITAETRTVFHAEGYKYENLKDALNYAMLTAERKAAYNEE